MPRRHDCLDCVLRFSPKMEINCGVNRVNENKSFFTTTQKTKFSLSFKKADKGIATEILLYLNYGEWIEWPGGPS